MGGGWEAVLAGKGVREKEQGDKKGWGVLRGELDGRPARDSGLDWGQAK